MVNAREVANQRTPRVSVVIPALNEARNLPYVLGGLPADVFEVLLVDGDSEDGTVEVARRLRRDVRVVHQTRRGKGNALACGLAAAQGDIVVTLDADGSNDPAEIPSFVAALMEGADLAKGTRFTRGGGSHDLTWVRRAGNRLLSGLFNTAFETRFTDLCYGFNALWAHSVELLELDPAPAVGVRAGPAWGDGFEFETLLAVRASVAGLRVAEVPSFEHPRLYGVSKLRAVPDGLRIASTILRERRRVRRSQVAHAAAVIWEKRLDARERGWPCQADLRSP
jgi:glycosyltransferase involved in cell wall biosynthesis